MYSLTASIRNETSKLALKKKTIFFLAMTLLLPVGASLLIANFQSSMGIGAVASREFPIVMLGLFTAVFLPLFVFMGAADQFSGEMADRTMKNVLTRPISRFKVFASKQISLGIYIATFLAAALLASILSSFLLKGSSGFGASMLEWIKAYGAAFLPLLTLSIAAVLLAQFFKSSSGALTTSILLYLTAKLGAIFFPQLAVYSPTSYTDWHVMWLGSPMATDKIFSVFMFLLACSILFFTVGFYLFDKKEL
ncbi:ABC transporter permease [Paenibacillus eucommiae]|uniref:ABC-2 type transport system permease protein n=1 Tax=Paenibacillus eucommiae TaxID=1355755 RepID=A0ABS4IXS5_9BACL|nr:ABC transporter permease [Paenibacillus eucommiae]MBP1992394.1 ABC-2 type transport system permease protein [Paenibacillus eucommiae]